MTLLEEAKAAKIDPAAFARWQATRTAHVDLEAAGYPTGFEEPTPGLGYDGGMIVDYGEGAECGRWSVPICNDEHTTNDLAEAELVLFVCHVLDHTPEFTEGDYSSSPVTP